MLFRFALREMMNSDPRGVIWYSFLGIRCQFGFRKRHVQTYRCRPDTLPRHIHSKQIGHNGVRLQPRQQPFKRLIFRSPFAWKAQAKPSLRSLIYLPLIRESHWSRSVDASSKQVSVCVIIHGAPLLTASQIATPVMLSSHFLPYSNWSLSEGAAEMSKALSDGKDVFCCFFFFPPCYDWLQFGPWGSAYQCCAASLPGWGIDWLIPVMWCAQFSHQQKPLFGESYGPTVLKGDAGWI